MIVRCNVYNELKENKCALLFDSWRKASQPRLSTIPEGTSHDNAATAEGSDPIVAQSTSGVCLNSTFPEAAAIDKGHGLGGNSSEENMWRRA